MTARPSAPTTLNAVAAATADGLATCTSWSPAADCRRAARRPPRSPASPRCCWPTTRPTTNWLAENLAPLLVKLAPSYSHSCWPPTTRRQELDAARRGAARRDADLRHRRSSRPTPSCGRSMPATRWRRCSRATRSRSSRSAPPPSRPAAGGGSAAIETDRRRRRRRASRRSSAPSCRRASGPS